MDLSPDALSHADRYKLLIGGITPRPIAWVSTRSPGGLLNLAPFSFFNGVSASPMLLMFCPANKPDGTEKDTLRNAAPRADGGTGEFVVSVVPAALGARMVRCAEDLDYGVSEFEAFGITAAASVAVAPPRVADSPLAFECVTERVIRFGQGVPGAGNMVIGKVVRIFAADPAINQRLHLDPAVLDTIGRLGGATYCRTNDRFEMPIGPG